MAYEYSIYGYVKTVWETTRHEGRQKHRDNGDISTRLVLTRGTQDSPCSSVLGKQRYLVGSTANAWEAGASLHTPDTLL